MLLDWLGPGHAFDPWDQLRDPDRAGTGGNCILFEKAQPQKVAARWDCTLWAIDAPRGLFRETYRALGRFG